MKFIHISDLHLGLRLFEYSMLEDQRHILDEIVKIVDRERPDGLIIAGDVYDRPVPPAEAVALFDGFLSSVRELGTLIFIIYGNHDSPERLAFASSALRDGGLHLSPVYDGSVKPVTLRDGFGELCLWLLPYIKPATMRHLFPDEECASHNDAVGKAISNLPIDRSKRNLLVTHQYVTGAARCGADELYGGSEESVVGGADNVDAELFEPFDYVALGHLHGPQEPARGRVRYCGTPLKYSFAEAAQKKSATMVELREKGAVLIRTLPLLPRRDLRLLHGGYDELMLRKNYEGTATDDYLYIVLTDEEPRYDAIGGLRTVYPNIMRVVYENAAALNAGETELEYTTEQRSEIDIIEEFFSLQNGRALSEEQRSLAERLICEINEERQ